MKQKAIYAILAALILALAGAAIYAWFFKGAVPAVNEYAKSHEEKTAKALPDQTVVIKHVHVYEKKAAAEKLGLPEDVANDPNIQALDGTAVEIPASDRPQSSVTMLNTETGEASVLTKTKPYKTFELQDKFHWGVAGGVSTAGNWGLTYVGVTPLRIKGVNVTIVGGALVAGKDHSMAGAGLAVHGTHSIGEMLK
jgi:hypothetical protein